MGSQYKKYVLILNPTKKSKENTIDYHVKAFMKLPNDMFTQL